MCAPYNLPFCFSPIGGVEGVVRSQVNWLASNQLVPCEQSECGKRALAVEGCEYFCNNSSVVNILQLTHLFC